jgi:hypothetical protein
MKPFMAEDSKKAPWFRDQFRDWVEGTLQETFDSLHDVRRSKLMARFFAEQVLRPRYLTLLPFAEEELRACVVDGTYDCGVDFVSREGGVVLILQAKYSGGKKVTKRPHEEPQDFQSFRTVLERLRRFRDRRMSEALKEVAADIDWETDRFQLYYITLKQSYTNQEDEAAEGVPPIAGIADLQDRVDLVFCDENRLNLELRDALSVENIEGKTFRLQFADNDDNDPWLKLGDSEARPCFVGRVSGAQLATLFQQHKSSLFTLNIRNYIGDNGTNRAIRKTAIDSPGDFFSFNNGISALAARITPDDRDPRVLFCERLSIINGAQTIRSLHKAHIANPAALREVHVLLRITQFDPKKTQAEQEFLDNVTKFNNTQNAIKLSDFRSNDRVQFDLRKKFDHLPSLGGRKFSYKNKRSGERERDVIVIGMEEFVKTLYAFQYGPDDVFGGTGHVFDATKGGGYAKLFGDDSGEILPAISVEKFEVYAGIWFLCDTAKQIWRTRSRESSEPGIERRWMFYYALGESIRLSHMKQGVELAAALRYLSNSAWLKEGENGPVSKVVARHCKVAFRALIASYKEASKDPGFAHRNWFRSQATLGSIMEHVAEDWSLVSEHGQEYLFPTRKAH